MKVFVCLIFFGFYALLPAQNIRVSDVETGEPVVNAALYNEDKSKTAVTDLEGLVNIEIFSNSERIYIAHLGYGLKKILKRKIKNKKIFLYPKTQELDEIVLSVSKWEQQKKDIPQKIASINLDVIEMGNPQTSADLLSKSGQVFVQKSQLGGGSPMIRGFATNRVLLSIDGVRMNNAIFRGGNIQNVISIDPFSVQKTEVIFGPGSVIYGSDAIGGVMNFYTKKPAVGSDSLSLTGMAATRYATANKEKTGHLEIGVAEKKWGLLTSITYSDFDDLKMGKNGPSEYLRNFFVSRISGEDRVVRNPEPRIQKPTGFNQWYFMQKARFIPSDLWELNLGLHYSATSDYPRYDRLIRTEDRLPRSAEWYYGPQKWFMGNLQIERKKKTALYDGFKFTTAFQNFKESRHNRDFESDVRFDNRESVNAFSLNADFEKLFTNKTKLFYGLEYVHNKVFSEGSEVHIGNGRKSAAATRYPDESTWKTIAGFVNMEHKLQSNMSLLSGLRYSHAFVDAQFDNTFYDFPFSATKVDNGALTGSIGISWLPGKRWHITLNGSTGFRAPNIDDIGKIFDSEPGAVVVPNPDLEAEYAYNIEMGLRKNFEDKFIISGATFYTFLKDALVRRNFTLNGLSEIMYQGELSTVQAIQNAANAYVYGFEMGVEAYLTEQLSFNSHLTLTKGKEELENGTEAPIRHAAPVFGDIHLLWKSNRLKLDAFIDFNGEIAFDNLAPTERNKAYIYATDSNGNPFSPSWHTVNVRSQYRLFNSLFATLTLENITNQRYRTYSSGIASAGTNFIASLSYRF